MTRKLGLVFGFVAMAAFATACSGGDGNKDSGGVKLDGGGGQDGTVPLPDTGVVKPDTGGTTEKTCSEILDCLGKCPQGDTACRGACEAAGSADAKTKYQAFQTCISGALTGSCAAKCPQGQQPSTDCLNCVDAACTAEQLACTGGTAFPDDAGKACAQPTECKSPGICLQLQSGKGFCTVQCSASGQTCPGAPAGTLAACIIGLQGGGNACGFICKTAQGTYTCPKDLQCGTTPNPAGSQQYVCEPK